MFAEKCPASKIVNHSKKSKESVRIKTISPQGSPKPVNEELRALRLRNQVLSEALQSIKETADLQAKKNLDLVWFARNRCKFVLFWRNVRWSALSHILRQNSAIRSALSKPQRAETY